jgi:hypothetical protein
MSESRKSPSELLQELLDLCKSPLMSREEVERIATHMANLPAFKRAVNGDPLMADVQALLVDAQPDRSGDLFLYGRAVGTELICEALNLRCSRSNTCRIGRLMHKLGYVSVKATRRLPRRYRAAKFAEVG